MKESGFYCSCYYSSCWSQRVVTTVAPGVRAAWAAQRLSGSGCGGPAAACLLGVRSSAEEYALALALRAVGAYQPSHTWRGRRRGGSHLMHLSQ